MKQFLAFLLSPCCICSVEANNNRVDTDHLLNLLQQKQYREILTLCENDQSEQCILISGVSYQEGPAEIRNGQKASQLLLSIPPYTRFYNVAHIILALAVLKGENNSLSLEDIRKDLLFVSSLGPYPEASSFVGDMLRLGQGGPVDYEEAEWQYRLALLSDNTQAYFGLGLLYREGLGVPKNELLAIDFWGKAADRGHIEAMFALGYLYLNGIDVEQNYSKAFTYNTAAVERKYLPAYANLGLQYLQGQGVEQDIAKACQLFEEAALLGDAVSKKNWEDLIQNGKCLSTKAGGSTSP